MIQNASLDQCCTGTMVCGYCAGCGGRAEVMASVNMRNTKSAAARDTPISDSIRGELLCRSVSEPDDAIPA